MNAIHELEVLYLYRCYCTRNGRTLKSTAQGEQRSFGDEHRAQRCQLFNSQQSTPPPGGGSSNCHTAAVRTGEESQDSCKKFMRLLKGEKKERGNNQDLFTRLSVTRAIKT